MDDIATLVDIAACIGVSRQAVEQALARAAGPRPLPVLTSGRFNFYRTADVETWWKERADQRWKERRRKSEQGSIQVSVRISGDTLACLDAIRSEGETRSAAARRILTAALLSRAGG